MPDTSAALSNACLNQGGASVRASKFGFVVRRVDG